MDGYWIHLFWFGFDWLLLFLLVTLLGMLHLIAQSTNQPCTVRCVVNSRINRLKIN